jgi:hypothetical protein
VEGNRGSLWTNSVKADIPGNLIKSASASRPLLLTRRLVTFSKPYWVTVALIPRKICFSLIVFTPFLQASSIASRAKLFDHAFPTIVKATLVALFSIFVGNNARITASANTLPVKIVGSGTPILCGADPEVKVVAFALLSCWKLGYREGVVLYPGHTGSNQKGKFLTLPIYEEFMRRNMKRKDRKEGDLTFSHRKIGMDFHHDREKYSFKSNFHD